MKKSNLKVEGPYFQSNGYAIRGYDPVAYFHEGGPVKGDTKWSLDWGGATWLFSSEENKEAFGLNPKKYTPQYGGYCAYAVSRDYTASIDPKAWSIVNGKLYLNYSLYVRTLWERKREENIIKADKNWPDLCQDL